MMKWEKKSKKGNKKYTLFAFGGNSYNSKKETLMMKYRSVWEEEYAENEWIPVEHAYKNSIRCVGDYFSPLAVIGGTNNSLLFLIHLPNHFDVIDIKSLQTVTNLTLPFYVNGDATIFVKGSQEMLVFTQDNGASIQYDEVKKEQYCFLCIQDVVIVFGGYHSNFIATDHIHLYFINTLTWKKCPYSLPWPMFGGFAILSPDQNWVHIIGRDKPYSEINKKQWSLKEVRKIVGFWVYHSKLRRLGWINEFCEIVAQFVDIY
ncbi:hypothetical protein RFI_07569 [Reticulomyxa filosa]|uniref:Kelch motif family protein n=1 Tax=Reticulomyxa filosa TaxID=46433 RepID=X6NUD9_RETFI|nr:hypothetical protein RFI_07569 [Reticulomyxa filosa]|eukprot:ETO29548.1 hypothetical protein RFI_07569 [Reticulomyxa filosa]